MAEESYFEKKIKINDLLQQTGLKIDCYSPGFKKLKSVNTIDKAIDFASSDIISKHSRVKDVSICIDEVGFTYYSAFSPLSYEDGLIEKLETYILEQQKAS